MMSLAAGATLTILVVEDDEAVAELLREVLNDVPGWGATVVHDAAAARAVFHYVEVEIMVLDLNLPGISGLELLELLRRDAEWRDPPVILISAAPSQPGVHEALEHGTVLRMIAKLFDVDQLVEAVRLAAVEYLDSGVL
jgi:DNA-binding response OmpR family regulator